MKDERLEWAYKHKYNDKKKYGIKETYGEDFHDSLNRLNHERAYWFRQMKVDMMFEDSWHLKRHALLFARMTEQVEEYRTLCNIIDRTR